MTGIIFTTFLSATEIDSFTLRDPSMKDALEELNQMMQNYFQQALFKANAANSCETGSLEEELHGLLRDSLWTPFEVDIENSTVLDRRTISREKSIYQDIPLIKGIALFMVKLGYLMRIGDFYVGSDKFGHFLETGYEYYHSESSEDSLKYGELTERTYFGLMTTSVYSYGDLAANLEGYRFWNQLTQGENAYFSCKDNTWVQQRSFTWENYVNAAWDEGINCSYYADKEITDFVESRITQLGMTCPMSPEYCEDMIEHYGYLAARVVTPKCF